MGALCLVLFKCIMSVFAWYLERLSSDDELRIRADRPAVPCMQQTTRLSASVGTSVKFYIVTLFTDLRRGSAKLR